MNRLERYFALGMPRVEGWLDRYSAEWIAGLSEIQRESNISAAVGEIGVHHGKLFLILLLGKIAHERALAIDIFEAQNLNIDQSGHGDLTKFLQNVHKWGVSDSEVAIIEKSSLEVTPDEIIKATGKLRLFSIDGGHTEQCALNDLLLAQQTLTAAGVVILDDVFQPDWPGVVSGLAKYIQMPAALRPFAITPNKVYLTQEAHCDFYRSEMSKKFKPRRQSIIFGALVDCYGLYEHESSIVGVIVNRLRDNALGRYAFLVKRYLSGQSLKVD